MIRNVSRDVVRFVVVLVACLCTVPAHADPTEPVRWGFTFNLGAGDTHGDFDPSFQNLYTGEFGFHRQQGQWRYGLGLSFGSFDMEPPYDHELEWGFQRIYVQGTRLFQPRGIFRPYLQGRLGFARLHPRSELFSKNPLPEDFEVGDSPTPSSNGFHIGLMPGVELPVTRSISIDASVLLDYFNVGETNLTPIGRPPASSGFDWSGRLGLMWWTTPGPDWPPPSYDAWGVRSSYAWGLGEGLAINFGASAFNEYVRNANFNQISPRSWVSNIKEGFTYDDNKFKTNQFIHPFNGSQYYNAGRSNGVSFWPSYSLALINAVGWELAGETHPMSFNDIISTGIGGAALGETQFRLSSLVLDNTLRGKPRFFHEAGGFLLDPIRGFNRILSGRAWKLDDNPSDPMDRTPIGGKNALLGGWREIGNGTYPTLKHDVSQYAFLGYRHLHGDVFKNTRRRPFDYMDMGAQWNFGDKTKLGGLMITGNFWTGPIGDSDKPKHMGALVQEFAYVNNNAFEFGGQSLGAVVWSRWGERGPLALSTRAHLLATILGAVNSDYSALAEVANQERIREYDYGPGGGIGGSVAIDYHHVPMFRASYDARLVYVTNGSVYHKDGKVGLDARHWLNSTELTFETPSYRKYGLGVNWGIFTRQSHYKVHPTQVDPEFSITQLKTQTNPVLKIYLLYRHEAGS